MVGISRQPGPSHLRALHTKLRRDLWRLRSQIASISLVVAAGVMTVITLRGGYESLIRAQDTYYRDSRFGDVWVSLERAPESLRDKIETIPGVADVETRVTLFATLDLPDVDAPGMGFFVSIPTPSRPYLNDIHIVWGRYPAAGSRDEVVVNEKFAIARRIQAGDTLRAVLNGRARSLTVVGAALSPEHSYAVPPGGLWPDDERYAVVWMARSALGPALNMEGAFNDVVIGLVPGASAPAVMRALDDLLDPFGGRGAYPRADQMSYQILAGELDQNRVMGTAIPGIFLGVAAFLLNLVLGRLIATQRTEIAVLKAFGYRNREIGWHYLAFALVAVAIGAAVGAIGGAWLGDGYIAMYGKFFGLPDLDHHISPLLFVIATGVSVAAAALGAMGAVRSAVTLPPAEAMRPAPPLHYHPGILERMGLGLILPPVGQVILRNIERRPMRTILSSLGVAVSVAILVLGMFMYDGVGHMMDIQFRQVQREDLAISFTKPLEGAVIHSLTALSGVTRVETYRTTPVRLWAGHREREVGLQGIKPDAQLRRIVTTGGGIHPLPSEGILVSEMLAKGLEVDVGDSLRIEMLEGQRRVTTVALVGTIDDFFGLAAYIDPEGLKRLTGEGEIVTGALLSIRKDKEEDLIGVLKNLPTVASVTSPSTMVENFNKQLSDTLLITVGFLLAFAGIISAGVIYNGARTALSERGRELASLRVMGFRRSEVSSLLLGEQAVVTFVAIPVGWGIGWVMALAITQSIQTELYRIPFVISPQTYMISGVVTVLAAAGSSWAVRRRVDRLDLISVLKTRE